MGIIVGILRLRLLQGRGLLIMGLYYSICFTLCNVVVSISLSSIPRQPQYYAPRVYITIRHNKFHNLYALVAWKVSCIAR